MNFSKELYKYKRLTEANVVVIGSREAEELSVVQEDLGKALVEYVTGLEEIIKVVILYTPNEIYCVRCGFHYSEEHTDDCEIGKARNV